MKCARSWRYLAPAACLVVAAGCSWWQRDQSTERELAPGDSTVSPPSGAAGARPEAAVAGTAVDAMVGQVNGRPIYAGQVFDVVHDQLATRGRQVSRADFRREARDIIGGRLLTIVMETLMLAQAEAALTEQQRFGLRHQLHEHRAELIRMHGQGSEKIADQRLRRQGSSLDEKVDDFRQQLVIQSHLHQKVTMKINVSRKDILRHYRRNHDEYHPKPGRTIHMISTADADDADTIDRLLAEGKSFLELASDGNLNTSNANTQGLVGAGLTGAQILTPELDGPMMKLDEGQHTPRITRGRTHYWVYVKTISTGKARSLNEVQLQIRRQLERQRFNSLADKYRAELYAKGSFDPVGPPDDPLLPMVTALLEVALNRYALPQ